MAQMKLIKILLGSLILLLPFVWIGYMIVKESGWKAMIFTYAATLGFILIVFVGVAILSSALEDD
jgi:ascorbate-specific PTS system EIIC-type component UlaA